MILPKMPPEFYLIVRVIPELEYRTGGCVQTKRDRKVVGRAFLFETQEQLDLEVERAIFEIQGGL